jgi:hypothetical protein
MMHNITTVLELNMLSRQTSKEVRRTEGFTAYLVPHFQKAKRKGLIQGKHMKVPCHKSGERELDIVRRPYPDVRWDSTATTLSQGD